MSADWTPQQHVESVLHDEFPCTCDPAYTDRGMVAPNCDAHGHEDIAARIIASLASETTDSRKAWYDRGYSEGLLAALNELPVASETTDAGPPEGADREALWAKFTAGEKLAYGCGYRDAKAEPVLDENLGRVRVYGYGLIDIGDALAFAKLHGWRLSESVG